MKEEPPTSAKCRDKFLVQSCLITPERETTSLSDIWGVVEKEDKNAVHEQKIRCAFLPATSAAVPEEGEEGNTSNGGDDVSICRHRGLKERFTDALPRLALTEILYGT